MVEEGLEAVGEVVEDLTPVDRCMYVCKYQKRRDSIFMEVRD